MMKSCLSSLPVYIPGKSAEALECEMGISGAVKLASNENPLGPSKKGMAALREGLSTLYQYPDGGASLLREAIANRWKVKPHQVIVGNGSDEIISLLVRAFILPGDQTIMADPSFAIYRLATLASHGKPVLIPLTPWTENKGGQHDLIRMAKAVSRKTRLIFICNPNNPTGTIVHHDAVVQFLSMLPKSVGVVMDEAYAEYATDPDYPASDQLLKQRHPIIFLRTFSKIYGLAGLRVGYGIGPADWIDLMNRIRSPFNVNLLAQKAALGALADETHVSKSLQVNNAAKNYLYRRFKDMGIEFLSSEANFICFRFAQKKEDPHKPLAKEVYEALLQKGVIIRHMGGPLLRVTLGRMFEMERFIRALSEVLTVLR